MVRGHYPVLPAVSRSYPRPEGRFSTRYSPVRRSSTPRRGLVARLACLIHAANVHSEPGSNPSIVYLLIRVGFNAATVGKLTKGFHLVAGLGKGRRHSNSSSSLQPAEKIRIEVVTTKLSKNKPPAPEPHYQKQHVQGRLVILTFLGPASTPPLRKYFFRRQSSTKPLQFKALWSGVATRHGPQPQTPPASDRRTTPGMNLTHPIDRWDAVPVV